MTKRDRDRMKRIALYAGETQELRTAIACQIKTVREQLNFELTRGDVCRCNLCGRSRGAEERQRLDVLHNLYREVTGGWELAS